MSKKLEGYKVDFDIEGLKINTNFRNDMRMLLAQNEVMQDGEIEIKIENEEQKKAIFNIFSEYISSDLLERIEGINLVIIKGKITSFELECKGKIDNIREDIIYSYKYINAGGRILPELRGIYQKGPKAKKLKHISGIEYTEVIRKSNNLKNER